jgi:hypothetical protein
MTQIDSNAVVAAGPSASPPPGIYVPTVTIFKKDARQELDLHAQAIHAVRYATLMVLAELTRAGWRKRA